MGHILLSSINTFFSEGLQELQNKMFYLAARLMRMSLALGQVHATEGAVNLTLHL